MNKQSAHILIFDGASQVPLGHQIFEAMRNEGVNISYVDGNALPKTRLYNIKRNIAKIQRKLKGEKGKYYHPKAEPAAVIEQFKKYKPDIVVIIGFSYHIMSKKLLAQLKKELGFTCYFWDTDSGNFFKDFRQFQFYLDHELSRYKHILTFSKQMANYLNDCQNIPAQFFPFGSPSFENKSVNKSNDILFVGDRGMRRLFALEQLKDQNIKVVGKRWKEFSHLMSSELKNKCHYENLYGETLHQEVRESKIILNITNEYFYGIETGINLRIFETLALGGFLLSDHYDELGELFTIGEEIETFKSFEEMKDKIEFYLRNDAAREKIARQGHEKFLANYTWQKRAQDLLAIIQQ